MNTPVTQKNVYFQTWGCQMNVADTERMMALLTVRNYQITQTVENADLIILNTCHIREKARHKVVSRLGELKPFKEANPNLILAVAGCVAQAESESLQKELPYIDLVFGPDHIEKLPMMLEDLMVTKKPIIATKFDGPTEGYSIPVDVVPPYYDEASSEVSRFVNIIKGCNNFCTFCVVPYTRGREKSRAQEEILDEVRFLVNKGVKEIVLLGQNVNSYGLDLMGAKSVQDLPDNQLPFAELLYDVHAVEGVERIRFCSSNPHDFTPALATAFAELPKVASSFHLAVQSGSDAILERMNRQYTRAQYLERVGWIRQVRPEMAFSTDVIVGFPGETEEDFQQTVSLIQEMNYSFIYGFKYSPRKGTPATRFKDAIPEKEKDRRLQILLDIQRQETERQNAAEVGKIRDVLVLYKNKKEEHSWYGRTFEGRLTKVQTPRNIIGQTVSVEITSANVVALMGRVV
jgi:tRNA-2-methylthio-N6-dimethylallyladenosine synthase